MSISAWYYVKLMKVSESGVVGIHYIELKWYVIPWNTENHITAGDESLLTSA